ncbi:hypothetical protein [Sphingomonas sp.]|uniref:hypothetical protein n=1 Tax=Sphingomonas sp. TaxID=28214 RepID=UPI002C7FE466|nr:hypothetical protein [Sphingomonas sp.]HWK37001.1 hypothetical protein [Sphingomonas sp.]
MDLSFARAHDHHVTALPTGLAVLLVGIVTRQAASPTARVQARLTLADPESEPLAPAAGAFNAIAAAALTGHQGE